jgi:hypothetical protein
MTMCPRLSEGSNVVPRTASPRLDDTVEGPPDLSPQQCRGGLVGCYVLHLAICALFVLLLFPAGEARPSLLYVDKGGDEITYLQQARSLAGGHAPRPRFPAGTSVLLLPLVLLVRPASAARLDPLTSAVWGLGAFPAGILVLWAIARRLLVRRWAALSAVALWILVPLALYLGVWLVHDPRLAFQWSISATWLQMLSDAPETLCVLLCILAVLKARESSGWAWAATAGALAGTATLIRYSGALLFGVVVVWLLWERGLKAAAAAGVAGLLVLTPQLAINAAFLGSPLRTGYQVPGMQSPDGLVSLAYLQHGLHRLVARVGVVLVPLGLALLGIGAAGLSHLRRRSSPAATALVVWFVLFVAFHALLYGSWEGSFTRYLMPVYVVVALLGAGALGWMAERRVATAAMAAGGAARSL